MKRGLNKDRVLSSTWSFFFFLVIFIYKDSKIPQCLRKNNVFACIAVCAHWFLLWLKEETQGGFSERFKWCLLQNKHMD